MTTQPANLACIPAAIKQEIDHWVAKYPAGQQRSAILAALKLMQKHNGGWLTDEIMEAVAAYLQLPPVAVFEVATFYDMFHREPVGKHKLAVCTNVSCMLRGSDEVLACIKQRLGISPGETTVDGLFTVHEVECLAACDGAPMCQVDDEYYHMNLTPTSINSLIDDILAKEEKAHA